MIIYIMCYTFDDYMISYRKNHEKQVVCDSFWGCFLFLSQNQG